MRTEDRIFIDGRWRTPPGDEIFTLCDPASEEPSGKVHFGSEQDAVDAVEAARRAFES